MKLLRSLSAVATAAGLSAATSVHAALPAAVSTAITTAETDMTLLYTTLTGAGVVIWVARLIYRKFSVR